MSDRLEKLTTLWEADPTDADVAYMIALEHGKLNDTDRAVHWLDQALSLNASYHYAYYQKGKLLNEAGDRAGAVTALQTGLAQARGDNAVKAESEIAALLDELR